MQEHAHISQRNRRLTGRLAVLATAMFGFGFLLSPLYGLFCEITGIGIRTPDVSAPPVAGQVDESRLVTIEFVAAVNESAPWEFRPAVATMRVHPGELRDTEFVARNLTDRRLIARAVPSIAPGEGAKYLRKTQCFCFESQEFAAAEARELGVQFYVDPAIPSYLDRITLSYTLFKQQLAAQLQTTDSQRVSQR
jgi:cytochrome c oxidase assembly protein subunit 11